MLQMGICDDSWTDLVNAWSESRTDILQQICGQFLNLICSCQYIDKEVYRR